MNKKTIKDIDVKGKRVLVRVDFNVPLNGDGKITDENRIQGALPTIKYLMDNGAKVILCSHMGKPHNIFTEGFGLTKKEKKKVAALPESEQAQATEEFLKKAQGDQKKFTLKVVADRLNELLDGKVAFASDLVGEDAKAKVNAVKEGEVVLLENTRFYAGEEKNDEKLAKELASFADIYVNDAFGTAHRAHASTEGVSHFVETSVSGFLIAKELEIMGGALDNPRRPFLAILGGAKVSDKIGVINNLLEKVDKLLIGGAMAYTFIKAQGGEIGNSLCELDKLDLANELLAKAKAKNVELLLPVDTVIAQEFKNDTPFKTVDSYKIPADWEGMDIGEKTSKIFADAVKGAKTIIWNGPMGVSEMPNFANGTKAVAMAMCETDATTIIGGGDSAAAIANLGFADKVTHISTGGGASLEFLEGKVLPGVACLNDKD